MRAGRALCIDWMNRPVNSLSCALRRSAALLCSGCAALLCATACGSPFPLRPDAGDPGAAITDAGDGDAGDGDAGNGDAGSPTVAGCAIFPSDNAWNRDISGDPVDPHSADYLSHMNAQTLFLHADFGSNPLYGQPFILVHGNQPRQPMTFLYASESDPGPYPFPPDIPIQAGQQSTGDRHAMALDIDNCVSYETYLTYWETDHFDCGSGAVFDLKTNQLRPDTWTSATASGLPIVAGMTRYHEVVELGELRHAVTFNVGSTAPFFVHPATHQSGTSSDPYAPPMGLRVRLRADYDLSRFHGAALTILKGLRRYGMMVVDNGTDWYISGEQDTRWDDADLNQLKTVPGSAFEVILLPPLQH